MGEALSERRSYIALNLLPLGSTTVAALLGRTASAAKALEIAVLRAPGGAPRRGSREPAWPPAADGTGPGLFRRQGDSDVEGPPGGSLPTASGLLERADREEERARTLSIEIVTLADGAYPALLREIPDPPPVLYVRGRLEPDHEVRVAIVGSRRASRYGLVVAEALAEGLARKGVTVVSGLARGVDAAAHRGALGAPARTLAVLGSGLPAIYPVEHTDLAQRIAASGAILSEYPLDLGPLPEFFPRRNRVISGLSAMVVVVEAARASGALVTARLALDQGRELGAVPGSILSETSAGTNALLLEGIAHVVTSSEDVLGALPGVFRVGLGLPASPLDEPAQPRDGRCGGQPRPGGPRGSHTHTGSVRTGVRSSLVDRPEDGAIRGGGLLAVGSCGGTPPRGGDEELVARHLSHDEPLSIDDLVERSGLPVPRLLAALSALEIRGLAVSLPGNRVALARAPVV